MGFLGEILFPRLSIFEPAFTGALLYLLTRAPHEVRDPVTSRLATLPYAPELSTVITGLTVLVGLGIVAKLNRGLNYVALNGWRLGAAGGKPYNWPSEVAVITGGSSGIGAQMVRNLAAKGVKIAIVDVQAPLKSFEEFPDVHFYKADITKLDNVKKVAAKIKADLGAPSILINNAGVGTPNTILSISEKELERIFHVNLIAHWYTVQAFLPDMIAQKKGHVVTIASMASFMCVAGIVDYCATKAGALAFSEGLRQELNHRYNARFIKTTVVHPSWVRTPLIGEFEAGVANGGLMNVEYVGNAITSSILSGKSAQIVLPPHLERVTGVRGWANWLQELARDTTARLTLDHAGI